MVLDVRPSSLLWRIVTLLVAIALTVIAVVVVLPITVMAGVILALFAAGVGARAWLMRAREPGGLLDGRKNVRVVRRPPGE
jgi:hypothetical protein